MSLGKGRWENRHQTQGAHQSYFCVVLLSLVEHDFNVLILETKQKLVVFNFHIKQNTRVLSLWLSCIGRNSLHCFVNVELGILRTLPLSCIMPAFQRCMWRTTRFVLECPCVIYGVGRDTAWNWGAYAVEACLVLKFRVCNGWTSLTTRRLFRVWQQLLRQKTNLKCLPAKHVKSM